MTIGFIMIMRKKTKTDCVILLHYRNVELNESLQVVQVKW